MKWLLALIGALSIFGSSKSVYACESHGADMSESEKRSLAIALARAKVVVENVDPSKDARSTIQFKLDMVQVLLDQAKKKTQMSEGPDTEDF